MPEQSPIPVLAPVHGSAIGLEEVPDPVFSQGMVGPGGAVDPAREPQTAVAPVAGTIATLHPHAFVITAHDGRGILVHLGIDTVELKGEGFTTLSERGARVEAGDPLVRWDPAAVEAGGRSPVVPVVALEAAADALDGIAESGEVQAGTTVLFGWE